MACRYIFSIFVLSVLSGCASSPESKRDALPVLVPNGWDARELSGGLSREGPISWVRAMGDPQLEILVHRALENNYDLQAAAAGLKVTRSQAVIAGAPQFPVVDGTMSATRQKVNFSGSALSPASALASQEPVTSHSEEYNPGLSISWELDLWGKLRNRTSAAIAEAEASEATLDGARLSIAAQTARGWYRFIEADGQAMLAEETAQVYEANREIVEDRFERGLVDTLDVRLIRNNTASANAVLVARRAERDSALRTLKTLLGSYPSADFEGAGVMPDRLPPVQPGLPSSLIERRPDLIAAERLLAAEGERVHAARKDMLPSISLTAGGGIRSDELKDTLDADYNVWRLASNLVQPIFQGKRLSAALEARKARSEQALAEYASIALQAFSEVEVALAAEVFLKNRRGHLNEAVEEAVAAEKLSWERYQNGLTDIVTLLDAQRRAFNAKSTLLAVRRQQLENRINLYLALGGEL